MINETFPETITKNFLMHFLGESCLTLKFFQCVKEMHFYTQCLENQQKYLIWFFNVVKWDFLRDFQTLCSFLAEQLTDWSDNLFPYFLAGYGYFWGSLPPNWNGAKSLRFLHCRRFSSGAKIRRNGGEDPRSKTIHQTGQWNGAENQHRHQRKFQLSSYCKLRHFQEFSMGGSLTFVVIKCVINVLSVWHCSTNYDNKNQWYPMEIFHTLCYATLSQTVL